MEQRDGAQRRIARLPVICDRCDSRSVVALRGGQPGSEQVVICCEVCGARIFAYTTGRERQPGGSLPEGDAFFARQVERELLRQVTRSAAALYQVVRDYAHRHGYAPTLREMQQAMGWRSANAVTHNLRQLERAGLIERDYGEPRGIRLPHAA